MTDFKRRLVTGIATGALLLNALSPLAFADTNIVISGNGSDSHSNATVNASQTTNVVQNNTASVSNNVTSSANSGNNSAKDNTGGNVSVNTGDATTNTSVSNALNQNTANVDCNCNNGNTNVEVSGNGSHSNNTANVSIGNETNVYQDNAASVSNNVNSHANTGGNKAKDNTGGNVSIDTGDALTHTSVSTTANANFANVGGGSGAGDLSVKIVGNGSHSRNSIKLDAEDETTLTQANLASVSNNVNSDANSGYNKAKDNTGGDVMIDTGDATAKDSVDTAVNFNWADLNCGCLLGGDVLAKIADNGHKSHNYLTANIGSEQEAFQNNLDSTSNSVDSHANSGENKAKDNTGEHGDDPSIDTGNAWGGSTVSNSGNVNLLNPAGDIELPNFDFNVDFSLTWAQLMAWLSIHS